MEASTRTTMDLRGWGVKHKKRTGNFNALPLPPLRAPRHPARTGPWPPPPPLGRRLSDIRGAQLRTTNKGLYIAYAPS
jgi:hypothetical protein